MLRFHFNKEEKEFLNNNYLDKSNTELVELFNKTFIKNIKLSNVINYKLVRKLRSNKFTNRELLNEEEKEYFAKNITGKTTKEFLEDFNRKFNRNITSKQVKNYKANHNFRSKIGFNFKKGNIPYNYVKIGAEKIRTVHGRTGTYIKLGKNNWIKKERYIYEKQNGKLTRNEIIIFVDGDSSNFNIENLTKVNKKEFTIMYKEKLLSNNADLTNTGLLLTRLKLKMREVEKNN